MPILDPVLSSRVKREEIQAAFAARFSPRQVRNSDLMVIASIFNQIKGSAASKLLAHLDDVITECLRPNFKLKSANVGQKFVFNALQLLSVQTTETERKMIELAIPALQSMRGASGQGASSVATFKPEYKEINTKSANYSKFIAELTKAYSGVVGCTVVNNNEIEFKDQGHVKRLCLINTGSMGAIFLVTDASGNPLKVIRTICVGKHEDLKAAKEAGLIPYPDRRAAQFSDYQSASAPNALLGAGNFHSINTKDPVHIIESFEYCTAPMLATRLKDPAVDPIKDLTAVAASLAEIHKSGLIATNLKPDNMHIESGANGEDINERFVNPSLFSHHTRIFKEYFAGSTPFRYYGDDYTAAFNGDTKAQTAEVAAKTDLWAFGVNLFQALVPGYLFSGDALAAKANGDVLLSVSDGLPAASSSIEQFLQSNNVAPHIKSKNGNFVRNIYSWASSAKQAEEEIRSRLEKALGSEGKNYSEQKKEAIKNLLVNLLVFKEVNGKRIMALDTNGTQPTAQWLHKQMTEIPT